MTNHEIEILLWVCGAIGVTWLAAYFVIVEQVKQAYDAGKADLNREILRAENRAYLIGYEKARATYAWGPSKTTPSKPKAANNSRKQVATAKKVAPKPAAKKPVKKVTKAN